MSAAPSVPPDYQPPPEQPPDTPRRRTWARTLAWVAAGVLAVFVLLAVALIVTLRSSQFHSYVLAKARQKGTEALGLQLHIRDFDLSFSGISPAVDVYGVTVEGAAPHPDPPILQVEHARVAVRIVSLLQRKWYLEQVQVYRPVVRIFVDKQGRNNFPTAKKKEEGQSRTDLFELGVRHVLLEAGEVYYNNRKSRLNADLHELNFRSGFDPGPKRYSGTAEYRNGRIVLESLNPIPHDLDAEFEATPERFTLRRATVRSGQSQVVLNATLEDYAHPKVRAKYDGLVDAGEFRRILKNAAVPAGLIRLAGSVQYATDPKRPLLETVTLSGDLNSRVLNVHMQNFRGDIRDISARYSLNRGNAEVRDLRARLLGGELSANAFMRQLATAPSSHVEARLRGVSLAAVKQFVNFPAMQRVSLDGTVNADADATWGKTLDSLVAQSNATLNARVARAGGRMSAVPLDGVIHARYAAAQKRLALANSYVRTPQTSINLDGTLGERSSLGVRLNSSDLHELEILAEMFRTPEPGKAVQALGLYGNASFTGAVTGQTSAPHLSGQLVAGELRLKGSSWRVLRANVEASPKVASVRNGELRPATGKGAIAFSVRAGLRNWSFTEKSPVEVAVKASQLNVAELAKAAGLQTPVAGILSADVQVRGSQLTPVGQGTFELKQAKIAGEPINSARVRFQGTGEAVAANFDVALPAGKANAVVNYLPKQQGYEAELRANGIRLEQLQAVKSRNMQITGVLNISGSGRGTLNDPQLVAKVEIPQLRMRNQTISNLMLQATVANQVANVALDSQLVNTGLRGRARINLTGNYDTEASLDTQPILLQPLLAIYAPEQAANISGQTELHGTLRGPLKNKEQLSAQVTIPVLAVAYKNAVQIGAPNPIRLDYSNGVLNLQRAALRGTGTDLQFQGTVPLNSTAPASLLLLGSIDLRLAQLLNPEIVSSGQVRFKIDSYGSRKDPNVQGQIEVVNANFSSGAAPLGLQNGNGLLELTKDRLNVTRFAGEVGGGRVSASGGVLYRPSLHFELALTGEKIRLLYPEGVRSGLDLNLALTGTTQNARLQGTVDLNQLSFTPGFDLMDAMGQFGGTTSAPPGRGFSNNLQLELAVRSPGGINLASRELSLEGTANLNLHGTAAQPVLLGRVNLSGGDLVFRGNRYVLQGGTIDFINPARTEPNLNLAVNTTVQQYDIAMHFEGPVDHLRTSYTSDPALPPSDIINLLAFGKTTEAATANPNPPGSLGAESAVASAVSGQVTSRVQKIAGISHLSVDPTLGGNQQNPGATVTVQQRVTSKIFVTFSTDVTSTQRQVIQLEYKITPRVSVSGTRDQNGGFAFDTRIRKNW